MTDNKFFIVNPAVKKAKAIVHPGKLPRDRQIDVCGQCHTNAMDRYTPLFSFRPGDKLADLFRVHQDPKFDTPAARLENNDELEAIIQSWMLDHVKDEIYTIAGQARAPFGIVYSTAELMTSPQLIHNDFFTESLSVELLITTQIIY